MSKPKQVFKEHSVLIQGSNRAVYSIHRKGQNDEQYSIVFECVEGGGNVPRNAASFMGLAQKLDIEKEFQSVAAVAESVLSSLTALKPGEVEIEFGVEMGGEMGIPLITKGEAKANFQVTLRWKEK